jgi:predicted RNA binding protein YcfA (HicA-like mRNA interferase family)
MSTDLYRRLTSLLKEAGCYFLRQGKGSHEIWYSPITGRAFTVPENIKPKPEAQVILKDAGVVGRL